MKANYAKPVDVTLFGKTYCLTISEARTLQAIAADADKWLEDERCRVMLTTMETLFVALNRRYRSTAKTLRAIWEDAVTIRGVCRAEFRGDGYTELEKIGVDLQQWESEVCYNTSTGEVHFRRTARKKGTDNE